jgi:hypothetical protein
LVLFADNFWLFGTSPQELSCMTSAWLDILQRSGGDYMVRNGIRYT